MDNILYLLREEIKQVEYITKAKYLYTSELNRNLVLLMESEENDFLYLSNKFGIIDPNNEIEPYKIRLINNSIRRTWLVITAEMINRKCRELGKNTISFMFAGDNFQDLEIMLKKFAFKIEQPMKHFRTKEAQLKWIYNSIQKNICSKLSNLLSTDQLS